MTTTSFLYPLFSRYIGKPAPISSFVGESWVRPLVRNIKTYISPFTRMLNYYVRPAVELGTTAAAAYHIGSEIADKIRDDYREYQADLAVKQNMPRTPLLGPPIPRSAEELADSVLEKEEKKMAKVGPPPLTGEEYEQLYGVNPDILPGRRDGLISMDGNDDDNKPSDVTVTELAMTEDDKKLAEVVLPQHAKILFSKPGKKQKFGPLLPSFAGVEKSERGRPPNNITGNITKYIGEVLDYMNSGYPVDKAIAAVGETPTKNLVSGTQSGMYARQLENLLRDPDQLTSRYLNNEWVPRPINEYIANLKGYSIDEEGKIYKQ